METENEAQEALKGLIREHGLRTADLDSMLDILCGLFDLVADCLESCHTPDREQTICNVDTALQELLGDMAARDALLQLCRRIVTLLYDPDKDAMLANLREDSREELRKGLLSLRLDS